MRETSKAAGRRLGEGWFTKYVRGVGIDIGCGDDPLTSDCRRWDYQFGDGDAQEMEGVEPESFDWVYSSNCGEHLADIAAGIRRWWELVKPGGYLLLLLPDEDLYEQGVFPSRWNADHKHTITIHKSASWSPVSVNLFDVLCSLSDHRIISVRTVDSGYDYRLKDTDQTLLGAEAAIEAVVFKLPA